MSETPRVVVTGMGACSALGSTLDEFEHGLLDATPGIDSHDEFHSVDGSPVWAGLADLPEDQPEPRGDGAAVTLPPDRADRTARLTLRAAAEALADAALTVGDDVASERTGLTVGTSHGGRSKIDACIIEDRWDADGAKSIIDDAAHHAQTAAVAKVLSIGGPVLTASSACSSGANAISTAFDLLRSGKADVVLAGGADAFSKLTHTGFDSLGAMADGACSPFSTETGLSLGEGAGIVVLETKEHAEARNANPVVELRGYGLSWDAFHHTRPHPNGAGLHRALNRALDEADLTPDDLDYINLHGTGTSANDSSETRAIERLYDDESEKAPPTSSLKSQTGHTLGAAAALGFIASVLAMQNDTVPATINYESARDGCTLDVVPNEARDVEVDHFAANSAAFGGVNAVLVGGDPSDERSLGERTSPGVSITGVGLVSPLGHDLDAFGTALADDASGIVAASDLDDRDYATAPVTDFSVRKLMPHLRVRRQNDVIKYASVAAGLALEDAGIRPSAQHERVGLVVGTTRGAAHSYETFIESVKHENWEQARASAFTKLVMSSIGGYVSQGHKLQGMASTVVSGVTSGLAALARGQEYLRRNEDMDAVVVLAADEVSPLYQNLMGHLGRLSTDAVHPYAENSDGMALGEGAAAFVLQRQPEPRGDGAPVRRYADLSGYALSHDLGDDPLTPDASGGGLARAVQQALDDASAQSTVQPDVVYGHGRGLPADDKRELAALDTLGWSDVPLGCVNGHTGVAEAASGLYSVAAALLSLDRNAVYGPRTPSDRLVDHPAFDADPAETLRRAVVMGSTEYGNNTAVVLDAPAA